MRHQQKLMQKKKKLEYARFITVIPTDSGSVKNIQ